MRVLLLVVDGLGIGCLPDYLKFSNTYTNTLSDVCEGLSIPNLQKLGLLNLVKKEYSLNDDNVESYGRLGMLCKRLSFDDGFNEILGDVDCENGKSNSDNLLLRLNKNDIQTLFIRSGVGIKADVLYSKDKEIFNHFNLNGILDNSVTIIRLCDFAKYGLAGDNNEMSACLEEYDNFVGKLIDDMYEDDLLIFAGNFGVSVTEKRVTREYNPLLIYSKETLIEGNLSTIMGGNCVAYTIVDMLNVYPNKYTLIDEPTKEKLFSLHTKEVADKIFSYIDKVFGGINEKLGDFNEKLGDKIKSAKKSLNMKEEDNDNTSK